MHRQPDVACARPLEGGGQHAGVLGDDGRGGRLGDGVQRIGWVIGGSLKKDEFPIFYVHTMRFAIRARASEAQVSHRLRPRVLELWPDLERTRITSPVNGIVIEYAGEAIRALSMAAVEVIFPQVYGGRMYVVVFELTLLFSYLFLAIQSAREHPQ